MEESDTATDLQRRAVFLELDAQVKDGEVRRIGVTWKRSRHLGPLAGAHAGVTDNTDLGRSVRIMSAVLGTLPRTGTILISFTDGTRHEVALLAGTDEQRQSVDVAVSRFNAMADAAAKVGGPEANEKQ
jgi:hypothetical protein